MSSSIIYDERGYVASLERDGSTKTYIFSNHKLGTCISAHLIRAEDYDRIEVIAEPVGDEHFYYYLFAENLTTFSSTWIGLCSEMESRILSRRLKEIEREQKILTAQQGGSGSQTPQMADTAEEAYYNEQRAWIAVAERETEALAICSGCSKTNWQCDGNHAVIEGT